MVRAVGPNAGAHPIPFAVFSRGVRGSKTISPRSTVRSEIEKSRSSERCGKYVFIISVVEAIFTAKVVLQVFRLLMRAWLGHVAYLRRICKGKTEFDDFDLPLTEEMRSEVNSWRLPAGICHWCVGGRDGNVKPYETGKVPNLLYPLEACRRRIFM
jgi:hypothetical protein